MPAFSPRPLTQSALPREPQVLVVMAKEWVLNEWGLQPQFESLSLADDHNALSILLLVSLYHMLLHPTPPFFSIMCILCCCFFAPLSLVFPSKLTMIRKKTALSSEVACTFFSTYFVFDYLLPHVVCCVSLGVWERRWMCTYTGLIPC